MQQVQPSIQLARLPQHALQRGPHRLRQSSHLSRAIRSDALASAGAARPRQPE